MKLVNMLNVQDVNNKGTKRTSATIFMVDLEHIKAGRFKMGLILK